MDFTFYLGILTRRWWLIVLSIILVSGFSYVKAMREPIWYFAQVRMLYEQNTIASQVLGSAGLQVPMAWNNPVDTQLRLIATRPNIEEVVKRLTTDLRFRDNPLSIEEIAMGISTSVDPSTDIIIVGFRSLKREAVVPIVNELAKVFVERDRSFHQDSAQQTRKFIEEQLSKTQGMLHEAEDAIRKFQETNKVMGAGQVGGAAAGRLAEIDSQTMQMEAERQLQNHRLNEAKRHLELTDEATVRRLEKLHADVIFSTLQGEVSRLQANIEVKKSTYMPDSPEIKLLDAQLARLKGSLEKRIRQLLDKNENLGGVDIMAGRTATEERYFAQMIDAQAQLTVMEIRMQGFKASQSYYERRFSGMPAKEQQLTELFRRQKAADETYTVFLKRMQEIRITEALNSGNVRVVEEAAVSAASASTVFRTVTVAMLMGLVFGLGIALLMEFLDDRIRRPEEAQSVLDLPILGMLPYVDMRDANRLVVLDDPRSPVTESYRALQTYTRLVDPNAPHQCLMITSPGPKEGKSTVLANLAVTSAQLGRRTLIVDTDLRAPSQHILFDRPNLVGIYDIVFDGCPLADAIQPTDIDNLDILCTGPVPPDPVQVLHSEAFRKLLERLREQYDQIFFDSPPINLFTDAAVLGGVVDRVLLVVDVRSTTRQSTLIAKDLLIKARVPLCGMVVKNTPPQGNRNQSRYFQRYYMDRLQHLADE